MDAVIHLLMKWNANPDVLINETTEPESQIPFIAVLITFLPGISWVNVLSCPLSDRFWKTMQQSFNTTN